MYIFLTRPFDTHFITDNLAYWWRSRDVFNREPEGSYRLVTVKNDTTTRNVFGTRYRGLEAGGTFVHFIFPGNQKFDLNIGIIPSLAQCKKSICGEHLQHEASSDKPDKTLLPFYVKVARGKHSDSLEKSIGPLTFPVKQTLFSC